MLIADMFAVDTPHQTAIAAALQKLMDERDAAWAGCDGWERRAAEMERDCNAQAARAEAAEARVKELMDERDKEHVRSLKAEA